VKGGRGGEGSSAVEVDSRGGSVGVATEYEESRVGVRFPQSGGAQGGCYAGGRKRVDREGATPALVKVQPLTSFPVLLENRRVTNRKGEKT